MTPTDPTITRVASAIGLVYHKDYADHCRKHGMAILPDGPDFLAFAIVAALKELETIKADSLKVKK